MAKIFGTHNCTQCKHFINWEYLIPQEYNSRWEVTPIDRNRVQAKRMNPIHDEILKLRVICPRCLADNFFEHTADSDD